MPQVLPVNQNQAVYNAVKIKIETPQNTIAGMKDADRGEYNGVNIEICEPAHHKRSIYSYPVSQEVVTYSQIAPANVSVPKPVVTNPEAEKNLAFHGVNFKSSKPEIIPPADLKQSVDINSVVSALESDNFDTQAKQMKEIVALALNDEENAKPYITTPVISALISILNKDTSTLQGPDEAQIEIRKKIIINEILKEQQLAENKNPEEVKLPFELTEDDYQKADKLNPLEMAERNKKYAIYTVASLAKIYADDFEKETGNVVPLTDLPGVSDIVDILRKSENSSLKITALETLLYINRPEYKDEISAIFKIVGTDKDKMVAQTAIIGLQMMEGNLQ